MAKFINGGAVELYHNNELQCLTRANGLEIKTAGDTDSELTVSGPENRAAVLNLQADDGDDNADIFRFVVSTSSDFYLQNYAGGSYETNIKALGNGAVELYHNNTKKFETHDVGTIFTEAGSGVTQGAIKVNTTLDTYGSVIVRDRRDVDVAVAAFQVENASNGSNETNLLLRSVNLGTTAFAHGIYAAKSHRFGVSSNTTPTVQIDSDGLKFNNDQASANALDDYEEGTWTPALHAGETCSVYDARYTKIGRQVTAYCYIYNFSDFSGNTNNFNIDGLPFTASGSNYHGGGFIGYAGSWNYSYPILPLVVQSSSTGYFHRQDGTTSVWHYVDFHNTGNGTNGQLIVTFVYFAAT